MIDARSKDAAEFVRLLFRLGRLDKRDLTNWADSVIEKYFEPPSWIVNLATAGNLPADKIDSLLQAVSGQVTDDLPRKMAASRLREEWVSGRCSDESFINGWYALFPEYPDDAESMHAAPVWQYLDEVLVTIYCGEDARVSLESARAELVRLLEPYAGFAQLTRLLARR